MQTEELISLKKELENMECLRSCECRMLALFSSVPHNVICTARQLMEIAVAVGLGRPGIFRGNDSQSVELKWPGRDHVIMVSAAELDCLWMDEPIPLSENALRTVIHYIRDHQD